MERAAKKSLQQFQPQEVRYLVASTGAHSMFFMLLVLFTRLCVWGYRFTAEAVRLQG